MEKQLIYRNLLCKEEDVEGFILEGKAKVTFDRGRMKLSSTVDPSKGQLANYVFWCPEVFPADVEISWNFYPLADEGLCMMFFSAAGWDGRDLFDEKLVRRDGQYDCYFDGDINAFHASYYRRKAASERAFRTCNLRKSKGFYLVAQGADPLPEIKDCRAPYRIRIVKYKNQVAFLINDLEIYRFTDDGQAYGQVLPGGRIGFRQMAPMTAEYSDLRVYALGAAKREEELE